MVGKQFAADGNVKQTVTFWLVLVPWWEKFLNISGEYVEVLCAIFYKIMQNFIKPKCMRPYFSEAECDTIKIACPKFYLNLLV